MHINVMQLESSRLVQDAVKDHPLAPYFVLSVARGPDVAKVRSVTGICMPGKGWPAWDVMGLAGKNSVELGPVGLGWLVSAGTS
jgi:hypothetical protein